MTVTYRVLLNFNDDADFADSGEDISADVLAINWRLGFDAPYQGLAPPAHARITVRSPTRAYSPEITSALTTGTPLRIESDDGTTTRVHFTGSISRLEPLPGDQGEKTALIIAESADSALRTAFTRLPPQVNKSAGQIIEALLDTIPLRRPALAGYWILGIVGNSELGSSTRLIGAYPRAIAHGQSVFAYAADTWAEGVPADAAIAQTATSERGRFFADRDGALIFHDRHHMLLDITPQAAFDDDMDGLLYHYETDIANRVAVTVTPRSIGAANTVLWSLENPQLIQPGEEGMRQIIARYRDAEGRPQGAVTVLPLVAGTDYEANPLSNGLGPDYTASLLVQMHADASAATITLRNTSPYPLYLLAGAQIRGTPLLLNDPITLEQNDWSSLTFYGPHTFTLEPPFLTSIEEANDLAGFELARRKNPRGLVQSMQLNGPTHLPEILARTLFDRVTISETQTGHSADYFIIAEEHTVDLGGTRHRADWLLESAAASTFWIVGLSTLDQTTILAY